MRLIAFLMCLRLGVAISEGDWGESLFVLTVIGGLLGLMTVLLEQFLEFMREEKQRGFDALQSELERANSSKEAT